jgi:glucose/arabinose dehydrogenase
MKQLLILLSLTIFLTSCKANSQPKIAAPATRPGNSIKLLIDKRDVIWGFDFIDAEHIIFTERHGSMGILDLTNYGVVPVLDVPATVTGSQAGLMDVVLHPDFAKNKRVYFSYSVELPKSRETRISRAVLKDNHLTELEILFTSNSDSNTGVHYGSRIVFDHEGHIFFSVGERGQQDDAQNLSKANGKIHRLMEDGKIPADNPFVKTKLAVPSIWSYGHRNPQGLYYGLKTKTLWEQEHGPKGGDEINIIEKGKNYGWPIITHGKEYNGSYIGPAQKDGLEQPVYYYVPSIGPSGLTMYENNLYSGALALMHLNRLVLDGKKIVREERLMEKAKERIRNVKSGPDGLLYISTDSGKIFQITL